MDNNWVYFLADGQIRFAQDSKRTHSIHPQALTVLSTAGPASAQFLLAATSRIGEQPRPGEPPKKVDVGKEPFRTVVENVGGFSKAKKAAMALASDAPSLSRSAVSVFTDGASGRRKSTGGPDSMGMGMGTTQGHSGRHPVLDQPVKKSLSRDPVCRAVVRLQRARVLAAAHALATEEKGGGGRRASASGPSAPARPLSSRPGTVGSSATARRSPSPPRPTLLSYKSAEFDSTLGRHLFGGRDLTGSSAGSMSPRPGGLGPRPGTAANARRMDSEETQEVLRDLARVGQRLASARSRRGSQSPTRMFYPPGPPAGAEGIPWTLEPLPLDTGGLEGHAEGLDLPAMDWGRHSVSSLQSGGSVSPARSMSPAPHAPLVPVLALPRGTRPGTAGAVSTFRPRSRAGTAYTGMTRTVHTAKGSSRPGTAPVRPLPLGVHPLPKEEYQNTARVMSAAMRQGRTATDVEIALSQENYHKEQEAKAAAVRARLDEAEERRRNLLEKMAEDDHRKADRADFLRRQRAWMTVVCVVQGLMGMHMFVNDENAKRALQRKKQECGLRIVKWARKQLMLRELATLARKRRLVLNTMGGWIRKRHTRRMVAAARVVRAFLTQAAAMSTQVRTIMQYRAYSRAVRVISTFLVGVRDKRQAQLRVTRMIWDQVESAKREDCAASITYCYQFGLANAAPGVVSLMRKLNIAHAGAALTRAQSIRDAAKRWVRPGQGESRADEKGAEAGKGKPSKVSVNPTLDMGGGMSIEIGPGTTYDNVLTALQPVPSHEVTTAIARFLLYRRQERWAEVCSYRRTLAAMRPHLAAQRKRMELSQRLYFKGPASIFQFDETEFRTLLPRLPPHFRKVPTGPEVISLVEAVQDEWFKRLASVYSAEDSGAVPTAKGTKSGDLDADDRKLERVMNAAAAKVVLRR